MPTRRSHTRKIKSGGVTKHVSVKSTTVKHPKKGSARKRRTK